MRSSAARLKRLEARLEGRWFSAPKESPRPAEVCYALVPGDAPDALRRTLDRARERGARTVHLLTDLADSERLFGPQTRAVDRLVFRDDTAAEIGPAVLVFLPVAEGGATLILPGEGCTHAQYEAGVNHVRAAYGLPPMEPEAQPLTPPTPFIVRSNGNGNGKLNGRDREVIA